MKCFEYNSKSREMTPNFFLLINQSSSDIKFLIELNFKNVYTLVIYHLLWKIDTSNAMEKSVG